MSARWAVNLRGLDGRLRSAPSVAEEGHRCVATVGHDICGMGRRLSSEKRTGEWATAEDDGPGRSAHSRTQRKQPQRGPGNTCAGRWDPRKVNRRKPSDAVKYFVSVFNDGSVKEKIRTQLSLPRILYCPRDRQNLHAICKFATIGRLFYWHCLIRFQEFWEEFPQRCYAMSK